MLILNVKLLPKWASVKGSNPWVITPKVLRSKKEYTFSKNNANCGIFCLYMNMNIKNPLMRMTIYSSSNVIFLSLNSVYKISNQALNFYFFLLHSRQWFSKNSVVVKWNYRMPLLTILTIIQQGNMKLLD